MNKAELVATLKTRRRELEELLSQMTELQMLQPGAEGDWSVRDIVAHLTIWEIRGTNWIRAMAQGEIPQVPEPGFTPGDLDHLNEETYQAAQKQPLPDVLEEFQQAFPILLSVVETLSEDDLRRVFEGEWTNDELTYGWEIVAWRFYHYAAHTRQIRAWLDELNSEV